MSKFPVAEKTINVRGQDYRVRELTHKERTQIMKAVMEDKFRATALFASAGAIEPAFTEEEADSMSSFVVEAVAKEVMKLSGMDPEENSDAKKA